MFGLARFGVLGTAARSARAVTALLTEAGAALVVELRNRLTGEAGAMLLTELGEPFLVEPISTIALE